MIKIYCDESGFTGSKLLDLDQPYFIYGAIELDDNEAISIVDNIKKSSNIPNTTELKYKTLGKNKQKIVQDLINQYKSKIFLDVSYKPYTLSSWFSFYITTMFADIYMPFPMLFSNYIYENHFKLVENFYEYFLQEKTESQMDKKKHKDFLLQCIEILSINIPNINNLIKYISTDEMDWLKSNNNLFDLSVSSVNTLTKSFSTNNPHPLFYCDNSKPISKFVNKEILGNDKYAVEYRTLQNKICLDDSKTVEGLQVIDLIVSHIYTELKTKDLITWTEISKYLLRIEIQWHLHTKTTLLDNKDIIIDNIFNSFILHSQIDINTENTIGNRIVDKLALIENDDEAFNIMNEYFSTI